MKTKSEKNKKKILACELVEHLNDVTSARIDIHAGTGNLEVESMVGAAHLLLNGTLEYTEKTGPPVRTLFSEDGQARFTLKGDGARTSRFRLPWAACNGATEWRVHLNPAVLSEIAARSGGGNLRLDLSNLAITGVTAETGGGNIEVTLPRSETSLSLAASTGAGNVSVQVPSGFPARIHAASGLGKVIVDPIFEQVDSHIYQSPGFETAAARIESKVSTGAGNVVIRLIH
jgi:hypothetical protein